MSEVASLTTRIDNSRGSHFRERSEGVNLAATQTQDIDGTNSAHCKRIANKRAMTAPWDRLGAHDRHALFFREFD
jgi:hypothetical protein